MREEMMAYAVFVGLMILWGIYRSVHPKKGRKQYQREPDLTRTRRLTEDAMARLRSRDLERLMKTDFSFSTQVSPPSRVKLEVIQEQLQRCLNEMLVHLHMLPNIRLVVTDNPKEANEGKAMGLYRGRDILLLVQLNYTPEAILAALCHEVTHYFMAYLHINPAEEDLNEGLTEVTACLIGFSNIMLASDANRPLPYLIDAEFREVRRMLLIRRKELEKVQQQAASLKNAQDELKRHVSGAQEMMRQTRDILAVSVGNTGKLKKKDLQTVQTAMLSIENGTYAELLRRAEKPAAVLSEVLKQDREVLQICAELFQVLQAIRQT